MMPDAPGMFSTTIGWPSVRDTPSAKQPRHHVGRGARSGRHDQLDRPRSASVWACASAASASSGAQHSSARMQKTVTVTSRRLLDVSAQCIIARKVASEWRAIMSGELLLVGSIPLDTPQEVFETFGAPLGKYLFAMPDGEVGPRRHWISRVHYQVLAAPSRARNRAAAGARRERRRAAVSAQRRATPGGSR